MAVYERFEENISRSIWLLYILIVFEILYMISPFALFYYSGYAIPLNLLQQSPLTSWLTVYIFPHFTYNSSWLVNILLTLAWPLISIGLLLFLFGFIQIYWAKFTRKEVVTRGLYRIIRHPQYVGLAILGLGTTLYWSRFIVYIAYAGMLFLYYYLAKQEERICMARYGASYQEYLNTTGMFLPKSIEDKIPKISINLPPKGVKGIVSRILLYVVYMAIVIGLGFGMKSYTISNINKVTENNRVIISTAPMEGNRTNQAVSLAMSNEQVQELLASLEIKKQLIYVVPSDWIIPELDVRGTGKINMMLHTPTHGNGFDFDLNLYTVLVTEPIMFNGDAAGEQILKKGIGFIPLVSAKVDLDKNVVLSVSKKTDRGKWDGIPVPIY